MQELKGKLINYCWMNEAHKPKPHNWIWLWKTTVLATIGKTIKNHRLCMYMHIHNIRILDEDENEKWCKLMRNEREGARKRAGARQVSRNKVGCFSCLDSIKSNQVGGIPPVCVFHILGLNYLLIIWSSSALVSLLY